MDWLTDRLAGMRLEERSPLQIMYGIDGRREIPERLLEHLEGYRGSAPVRVGNNAATQLQLDIYGELVDSIYLYDKYGTPISHQSWDDLAHMVNWVCENWDQADEGIWETRGGRQQFHLLQAAVLGRGRARAADGHRPRAADRSGPPRSGPGSDLPSDPRAGLDQKARRRSSSITTPTFSTLRSC